MNETNFTMPNRQELQNALHWAVDPLDLDALQVLRAVDSEDHRWASDRFNEAYLIARGCIEADFDTRTLAVTEKGTDALDFYCEEAK